MSNLTIQFDDNDIVTKTRSEWLEQLVNKRVYEIDDTDDLDTYLKHILMNGIKGFNDYDDKTLINIIVDELEE
jgi:hypothetical protein